jgi:hypothetical protein
MYYEDYYEIEQSFDQSQLWSGKDPNYNYQQNPLNPGLENFGYNVSVNCVAHYVPADKVGLTKERE